jgi:predicted alpha/beta superfamily hydrolase
VAWGDQRPNPAARPDINPYYAVEATGVVRVQVAGGPVSPFKRDVLVWLPPGYDKPENAGAKYPVLYMHDGQNLFQKHPAVPAEWRADETAAALVEAGKVAPMIIVGIPHMGGQARYTEYAPFAAKRLESVTPRGDEYVGLIVGEIMPRIERQFRVKTGPANTVIGGASMGAIISLHAAMKHPDKFGSVLLESIAPLGEDNPTRDFFERSRGAVPGRVFFGMGTLEGAPQTPADPLNARYEAAMRSVAKLLEGKTQLKLVVGQTPHNEEAWAGRFGEALEFLFPPAK